MTDTLPQTPQADSEKSSEPKRKQKRQIGTLFGKPLYEADESNEKQSGRILEIHPPVYMALMHMNAHWDEQNQCYILRDVE
jgi:hypothetical protein